MNRLDITGTDGSKFNWLDPQNGMSLKYGMSILAMFARERRQSNRLSNNLISLLEKRDFNESFTDYCYSVNYCLSIYMNLNVTDGWDTTRDGRFDGEDIRESVSWQWDDIEAYLGLTEGDLDFIKDNEFPIGSVTEKRYLKIMYQVLTCFTHRLMTGVRSIRDICRKVKYARQENGGFIYKPFTWWWQPRLQSSPYPLKDDIDAYFEELINENIGANGTSTLSRDDSISWYYTGENQLYDNSEGVPVNTYNRGVSSKYNYTPPYDGTPGGTIGTGSANKYPLISSFYFTTDTLSLYGQRQLSSDHEFKIISAGNSFNSNMARNIGGTSGFMSEDKFYDQGYFQYKLVSLIDCTVTNGVANTEELSLAPIDDLSMYQEIAGDSNNSVSYGMSLQIIPCGDINNEYFSDFVTEEPSN